MTQQEFIELVARMTPVQFDVSDDQRESDVVAFNRLIEEATKLLGRR